MDEKLSEDEIAYHRQLLGELRAAQAAFQSWSRHIAGKYELKDGEVVLEDGTIKRADGA